MVLVQKLAVPVVTVQVLLEQQMLEKLEELEEIVFSIIPLVVEAVQKLVMEVQAVVQELVSSMELVVEEEHLPIQELQEMEVQEEEGHQMITLVVEEALVETVKLEHKEMTPDQVEMQMQMFS